MAIIAIPFLGLSLLPHAAGGVILAGGNSYIAGTYVSAEVVAAFTTASGVLSQMSAGASTLASAAASVATNPITLGVAAIAVVAIGGYCYFHGIPAPIVETLKGAGLAAKTSKGVMISVPKLAVALILLGGAGYIAYKFYKSIKARQVATIQTTRNPSANEQDAKEAVEAAFGKMAWATFGEAAWSTVEENGVKAAKAAQDAVDRVINMASIISGAAATKASEFSDFAAVKQKELSSKLSRIGKDFLALFTRRIEPS